MSRDIRKEIQVPIDELTLERRDKFFERGDNTRLAELANVTRETIGNCFKTKKAPISVARAMKSFYEEKEKLIEELNS